jgi:UDP-3-O-[3-hydroxymyristoyl] glucosamine N-acyltransferase
VFSRGEQIKEANMSRTARELAQYLGAKLEGEPLLPISGVASPEAAGVTDVIYLDSPRHRNRAANSKARCIVAQGGTRIEGKTVIESAEPKLAFAKAAEWLMPRLPARAEFHPTAIVATSARLGADVAVGPYVVIEEDAQIGRGTQIEAFCFVGRGAHVAENCRLHPRVTLYPGARLGNRVEVHSGAVIGGDGFGYVFGDGRHWKFPQIGSVEIEDDVEIGCNTTIDRGSLAKTRIGAGVKIDNLVQIAHNVGIGEHSVIAAQTGISGSSSLGSLVLVGGQAGIGDHAVIEDEANVGGQAGVLVGKTIRRGQTVWGTPARPLEKFKQHYAWSAQLPELLPKLIERIRKLEEGAKNRR